MSAELHCHSLFSIDGSGSPEELVDVAVENGVTTLGITEHDGYGSLKRAQIRAAERGINYISGLELSASFEDDSFHFLAFGFDPQNKNLLEVCKKHQSFYAINFQPILDKLIERGYDVTKEELDAALPERYPSHPNPVAAQWFARDYLVKKGVFSDAVSARQITDEIKNEIKKSEYEPKTSTNYIPLDKAIKVVHDAGGVLLLAHVGLYYPDNLEKQINLLDKILAIGLDGFELYHPSNLGQKHFSELVKYRDRRDCATSGGSDCHHARSTKTAGSGIGELNVPNYVVDTIEKSLLKIRG
ncbi:MAG: hypothetical protein COA79_06895 [Planctomycetota bacterium]|nr:MAG: hypothetical protein COA79_06895 [Planctomycetota bacterium]